MPTYILPPAVERKLITRHHVSKSELDQAFLNRTGPYILETRQKNQTTPPTEWFIARTDTDRLIKVVVVFDPPQGLFIKSAFEAGRAEIDFYTQKTGIAEDDL